MVPSYTEPMYHVVHGNVEAEAVTIKNITSMMSKATGVVDETMREVNALLIINAAARKATPYDRLGVPPERAIEGVNTVTAQADVQDTEIEAVDEKSEACFL